MSWEPGRERVRELIDAGEVDQVTQAREAATTILDQDVLTRW